jgi:hypothetical protein
MCFTRKKLYVVSYMATEYIKEFLNAAMENVCLRTADVEAS